MKILHASAECYGLAKTGGLADVVHALSAALRPHADVRICLPAYRGVFARLSNTCEVATLEIYGYAVRVIEGEMDAVTPPIWLVDCPDLFDRAGDPYRDRSGRDYADNALRFGLFSRVVALLGNGAADWQPDLLHLHDWQTGLAAAWSKALRPALPVLFTIHNLAYQGVFERATFDALELPAAWWDMEGVEYWGRFSFIKAGLNFSDAITTVSPSYAEEIKTPEFGCGLDGVLRKRSTELFGLLNGIDAEHWKPNTDPLIEMPYGRSNVTEGKTRNRHALQRVLGLAPAEVPLFIFIGRLADQKGADLLLAARDQLAALPLQLVILAAGDGELERACRAWAAAAPDRVAALIRMDEALAHRLTAAADFQLMPSRFEPCGLSQLYAQRYGTVPVVRATGGLRDTVTDVTAASLADHSATGILFADANVEGVMRGVHRALELYHSKSALIAVRRNGMSKDFSWHTAADRYRALYARLAAVSLTATPPADARQSGEA